MTDAMFDRAVRLTRELIAIRSENPPGAEDTIAGFVADRLHGAGIDARLVPLEEGRSSVVARIRGSGDGGSVVLCGHLDTVTTDPAKWARDPFAAEMDDERIWGLGAADMKAGVAAIVTVGLELVRRGLRSRRDVVLMLTCDEEYGYRGAAAVAASGAIDDAELVVIAEPTDGRIHVGQKGELWIAATFTGLEAHGSVPETGINTVLPAARLALDLQEAVDALPAIGGLGRTTLNVGTFHGGRQVNIVPDRTDVSFDARVVDEAHAERILAFVDETGRALAGAVGAGFEIRVVSYKPPIVSLIDSPAVREFVAAASQRMSERPRGDGAITPYSTDAVSIVPVLDVPIVVFGPGSIAQAHRPNEYVELASLRDALGALWAFVSTDAT